MLMRTLIEKLSVSQWRVLVFFCLALLAQILSVYSNLPYPALIKLVLFFLLATALFYIRKEECRVLFSRRVVIGFALFSCCAAASLVTGFHICIETANLYGGGISEIFLSPFTTLDILGFAALTAVSFLLTLFAYAFLRRTVAPRLYGLCYKGNTGCAKKAIPACLLLLLFWLPYLLSYWPGLIYGDSLASLKQVEGLVDIDNHHPVAYTALIGLFVKVVSLLGLDVTMGCGLYTVFQMIVLAYCVSYFSFWCIFRMHLKAHWAYAVVALFAISPYFAGLSISMWKDPLFSCGVILLSVKTIDLVLSGGSVVLESKSWMAVYVCACLAVGLLRSNGIAILAVEAVAICVFLIGQKGGFRKTLRRVALSTTACLVVALLVTGPIYGLLGVRAASSAEALGLPINQVARVVAYGGDLSSDERETLDKILPLDAYAEAYRPLCVDMLKWDPQFKQDAIDGSFIKTWISVGLKNPVRYIESAALLTVGYWAVNVPEVMNYSRNIEQGHPRNIEPEGDEDLNRLNIAADNLLRSDIAYDLFPIKTIYGLPLSLINWLVFFLIVCLCVEKRFAWFLGLMPTIGLIATLLLASPIWYWPRYGVAEQIMLPMYLVLLVFCFAPCNEGRITECDLDNEVQIASDFAVTGKGL